MAAAICHAREIDVLSQSNQSDYLINHHRPITLWPSSTSNFKLKKKVQRSCNASPTEIIFIISVHLNGL